MSRIFITGDTHGMLDVAKINEFDHWVFGHYHMDEDVGKFHLRCEWVDEIS